MRLVLRSFIYPFVAAGLACALAACGGGGGGGTSTVPGGGTGSGSSGGSGTGTTATGSAKATLSVSLQQYAPVQTTSVKRRVAFVSPATASISLTIVSVNGVATTGTPQTFAVGPTAPNCGSTTGIVTCNLSATLPIGTDVLAASTLDSNGHSLGTSQLQATIQQNATNVLPLAIGGTIASLEVFLSQHSFASGTVSKANVIVVPLDASGAAIVNPGNYSPAINVALAPTGSTHFSLITDGGTPATSGTLNSPDDQVVLSFDGSSGNGFTTITATAGSTITANTSASFNSIGLTATPSGLQYITTSSYIFTTAGQTGGIATIGGTGPYTITSSDPSVASVSGTSPNFTVTAVGYGAAGTTTITVTDSATPTAATTTIPVTFIAPAVSLSASLCYSSSSCTANSVTGPPGNTTLVATGGTGVYNYIFASSGTTTSSYVTVAQTGNQFVITPNGSGNDALLVASGNQIDYFAIISNSNALAQSLPKAAGFRISNGAYTSVGSASEDIVACTPTSGTLAGFTLTPGNPGSIAANAASASHGTIQCTDSLGYVASFPFSVFSIGFSTYGGSLIGATADEGFDSVGQTDMVTAINAGAGSITVTSGNTNVVAISNQVYTGPGETFTATATGAGTTNVTLTDATGASVTYSVSVTTTTIPVAGKTRLTP